MLRPTRPRNWCRVGQAELLCVVDDDCVGIRYVDIAFHNAGGDQDIVFVIDEIEDDLLQFFRFHLSVTDCYAGIGYFTANQILYLVNILDTVIVKENLVRYGSSRN